MTKTKAVQNWPTHHCVLGPESEKYGPFPAFSRETDRSIVEFGHQRKKKSQKK